VTTATAPTAPAAETPLVSPFEKWSSIGPDELREMLRYLEPIERMELFAALEGRPRRQLTFREYIAEQYPKFEFSWHNEVLIKRCQDVADGLLLRLMISEPPRHGKSMIASRLLPAYWLYRHPETFVGLAAYGDTLVRGHSRAVQRYYEGSGGIILPEVSAVGHWEITGGGGLWTTGISGGAMGKGFSLGVIDDPYKDEKEAQSSVVRATVEGFYDSTFYTRQAPGAAIVVIMTRWHEDDLVAWLLKAEHDSEDTPEGWHVIAFDALHDRDEFAKWRAELPKTVTVEDDPRQDEQALWPGTPEKPRWDEKKLRKIRRRYGGPTGYRWRCLYQQRPAPLEGGFFLMDLVKIVDVTPRLVRTCRSWDRAATKGCGAWDEMGPDNPPNDDADWTAGIRQGYDAAGMYYVTGFELGQWEPGARDRVIRRTVVADGRNVHQRGEQEPGAAGKSDARAFRRLCRGYSSSVDRTDENKETKAGPLASVISEDRYRVLRGPWNQTFFKFMRAFGKGAKWDDVPDAASIGFNWLSMFELRDLGADPTAEENGPDAPDDDTGSSQVDEY
jgi:predicted phage terminase large subunit-like protein